MYQFGILVFAIDFNQTVYEDGQCTLNCVCLAKILKPFQRHWNYTITSKHSPEFKARDRLIRFGEIAWYSFLNSVITI